MLNFEVGDSGRMELPRVMVFLDLKRGIMANDTLMDTIFLHESSFSQEVCFLVHVFIIFYTMKNAFKLLPMMCPKEASVRRHTADTG